MLDSLPIVWQHNVLITLYPLEFPQQNLNIGVISSLELNHKQVETARKGQEVCIKIENVGGDAPKMYGRHFDHEDLLISKVSTFTSFLLFIIVHYLGFLSIGNMWLCE